MEGSSVVPETLWVGGRASDYVCVLQAVHGAGCGPQVFAAFTNGLCYAFTPGVPLTIQDVTREPVWRANARQMATFHRIQVRETHLWARLSYFSNVCHTFLHWQKDQVRNACHVHFCLSLLLFSLHYDNTVSPFRSASSRGPCCSPSCASFSSSCRPPSPTQRNRKGTCKVLQGTIV